MFIKFSNLHIETFVSLCYNQFVPFLWANYRGLVKWYNNGLQNHCWEFDSLIPCHIVLLMQGYFFIDSTSLMVYNGVNKCGWCGNTRNGVESGVDA